MSQFVANAGGFAGGGCVLPDDRCHGDEDYFGNDNLYFPDPIANYFVREDLWFGVPTFRSPWWPAPTGFFVGAGATDVACVVDKLPHFTDIWGAMGCSARFAVVGVTRDAQGSPLGGVTVKLFRTSDDQLISQVVSDVNGNYSVTTPYYPDPHYLVCYKTGSPDTFGTTVNTLIAG